MGGEIHEKKNTAICGFVWLTMEKLILKYVFLIQLAKIIRYLTMSPVGYLSEAIHLSTVH